MKMLESPLKKLHEELGASFGEFAGWNVPMNYSSVIEEHLTVRRDVGIFDITHMGRLKISGSDALNLLEAAFTKRIGKTKEGRMSGPTLALNESARVIDDEMAYRLGAGDFLLVTNAAFKERMIDHLKWIAKVRGLDAMVEDITMRYALFAVQGPKSREVLEKAGIKYAGELEPLEFRVFEGAKDDGIFLLSRSGWTGEDGYEVWVRIEASIEVFKRLVSAGAKPVGIAARDSLRMEMGFVLGGNEYGEDPRLFPCATSLRYGMGAIDWEKSGFIGESVLRACRREGARWLRYGFVMKKDWARFIPRKGYGIYVDGIHVGWITSGNFSPILNRGIAQGYIDSRYAITGDAVEISDGKGRSGEAKIEDFPLIKK